jgi:hypothetical protein
MIETTEIKNNDIQSKTKFQKSFFFKDFFGHFFIEGYHGIKGI